MFFVVSNQTLCCVQTDFLLRANRLFVVCKQTLCCVQTDFLLYANRLFVVCKQTLCCVKIDSLLRANRLFVMLKQTLCCVHKRIINPVMLSDVYFQTVCNFKYFLRYKWIKFYKDINCSVLYYTIFEHDLPPPYEQIILMPKTSFATALADTIQEWTHSNRIRKKTFNDILI